MLEIKQINYLVIHCSDTPDNVNLKAIDIHKMHLDFGWDGIGYHKVIDREGKIEEGRPDYWVGAHTKGLNSQSLGVCLIGKTNFTEEQFLSLESVLKKWKKKYPNAKIKGHCEVIETHKTCPNFDVQEWCQQRNLM